MKKALYKACYNAYKSAKAYYDICCDNNDSLAFTHAYASLADKLEGISSVGLECEELPYNDFIELLNYQQTMVKKFEMQFGDA